MFPCYVKEGRDKDRSIAISRRLAGITIHGTEHTRAQREHTYHDYKCEQKQVFQKFQTQRNLAYLRLLFLLKV